MQDTLPEIALDLLEGILYYNSDTLRPPLWVRHEIRMLHPYVGLVRIEELELELGEDGGDCDVKLCHSQTMRKLAPYKTTIGQIK